MIELDPMYIESVVKMALAEDIGTGDITTLLTIPGDVPECDEVEGGFIAKQDGVAAGLGLVAGVYMNGGNIEPWQVDCQTSFQPYCDDGYRFRSGATLGVVKGQPRTILTGERVALNFLQRMSGIATLTARYVELVSHTKARIVDTRKTTPGLRRLEKYAVTVGGGFNHRFGLSDGILIKDNHIAVAGGVRKALEAAKARAPHTLKIEVEVVDLDMLREAIDSGAEAVLLDNMPLEMMREAVRIANGRVVLEASGGVNESTVAAIAETGVDLISLGALTHSAPALDISLEVRVG